jgi:hypothetical protein
MQHRIELAHLVAIAACAVASACTTTSGSGSGGSGSGSATTGGQAVQWVSVAKADTQEAFADPASLTFTGSMVDVRAKQNFASPQTAAKKDKTYLSSQSTYRVDCAARKVAYKDIQAYEAADLQGAVVQKATFYEKNLQWMDAPKGTVFGELLDYACEHAPASLPSTPPG